MTFFFFNHPATTEIYTLSLHDALPICKNSSHSSQLFPPPSTWRSGETLDATSTPLKWTSRCWRSEEHTSELQSRPHLVCRLLLEKKKILHRDGQLGAPASRYTRHGEHC